MRLSLLAGLGSVLVLTAAPRVPAQVADTGTVEVPSRFGFVETGSRLEAAASAQGITVFARVDHADNAARTGQSLRPTRVWLLGNPAVGTGVIQCDQRAALELPLRLLVREDAAGEVWVGYADPRELARRYALHDCLTTLDRMAAALASLARQAAGQP